MKKIFSICLMCLIGISLWAQEIKIAANVQDGENNDPLIGVSIIEVGTTNGVVTDIDGNFVLRVKSGATIQLSYVGYKTKEVKVKKAGDLGVITLDGEAISLKDVTIMGQIAQQQKTPVAVSQVSALEIEERLGSAEFPEVLKNTPGVHANGVGGGWGDSEIWMRGFDNTNVATMINGVPMNDMEGGTVYWSNWQGLSDVTSVMQTQRGMGASKLSAPSVGGTINIVTKGIDAKQGGNISYALGNDGYNKISMSVSTGLMKSGWAVTLMASKTWGNGYIQGTGFSGYSYFANIAKRINENHQLSLTAFGAPQNHWTRPGGKYGALSLEGWNEVKRFAKDGMDFRRYNPSYGIGSDGKQVGTNYNKYHKPQISLNHIWQINELSSLSTTAYVSIGRGYGGTAEPSPWSTYKYSDLTNGTANGKITDTFRDMTTGMFDYQAVETLNHNSTSGSELAICENRNNHNWVGLVSTYDKKWENGLEVTGGIDLRYYQGIHTAVVSNLLGGEYFVDATRKNSVLASNNSHRNDDAWVYEKLGIGDIAYRDYTGHVMQEGIFGSLEYSKNQLSAFINASINANHNWRVDRFYYDEEHQRSNTISKIGGTVKGGVNYNINNHNNVFLNAGYISRIPKFNALFMSSNTSHAINENAKNEQIASVELGYGFHNEYVALNVNGYFTEWMDKTMTKSENMNNADQTKYYMNMTGVNAQHMGLEFELKARPAKWVELNAMLSLGNWKWDSDSVIGYVYDEHGNAMTKEGNLTTPGAEDHAWAIINMKGIHVGGQAQTTANVGVTFKPFKGFRIGGEYTLYARNYSYYALSGSDLTLGKKMNVVEPYKCPVGGSLDLRASYTFDLGKCRATLAGNVTNVLNQYYIEKAWSAVSSSSGVAENNLNNIYYFYNKGRQWNLRLKVAF